MTIIVIHVYTYYFSYFLFLGKFAKVQKVKRADAAKKYREWSQQNWQSVTDDRNNTQDRQQKEFRENIGAVQTYSNPYDNGQPVELTTQYQYFWVDNKGTILGSNDPSVNPNQGSTSEWRKMEKQ